MDEHHAERLRAAILAFELDEPGVALPFSARLARETGWSRAEALGAIAEYKRFVALAATAGREVTPSEAVDAVWHLHLTYTRSYWERLCRDVIGRPLHHEPTRGGSGDDRRFRDAYAATLALYEATFGAAPPPDLWPPPEARFAPVRTRLVDTRRHWIVPKPRLAGTGRFAAGVAVGTGALAAGSAVAAEPTLLQRFGMTGATPWIVGGVILGAIGAGLWAIYRAISDAVAQARSGNRRPASADSGSGGGGCSSDSGSSSGSGGSGHGAAGHGGGHGGSGHGGGDGSSDSSGCGSSGCGGGGD